MARLAADRRHPDRRDRDAPRRVPRPRAAKLDSELRPVRTCAGARAARPRNRRAVRGSPREVRMTRVMPVLLVAAIALALPAQAATKAVKAGRLIDPSGRVVVNAMVVIENDRIVSVGTSPAPA